MLQWKPEKKAQPSDPLSNWRIRPIDITLSA
jgi:hypothetical protein